jgi:diguanylate cyclase (GGDEF)-like protein
MGRALSVLLVEDCEDDALLTLICLRQAGFDPQWRRVDNDQAMVAALDTSSWEVVISDHNMPSFSAPEALKLLRQKGLDLPFIIVSGSIGEEAAVRAMKAGAQDYIVKGQLGRLPAAIERELKDAHERRARHTAEEKIRFLAYFDPLTSLPNRASFCEHLLGLVKDPSRNGGALAVLSVTVGNLRDVNNTLGHTTGEQMLIELGKRLQLALPALHLRARIAADEFAVVLADGDIDSATNVARELQRTMATSICIDAVEVEPEISVGIAVYPGHGEEPEILLQRANAAHSHAAESVAPVAIYDREHDPYQPERLSMISELRKAIETGQLRLQYQPKVCFATGELKGVEALVRWTHPKLGMLPPDRFIPLAEQTGLINPLTRWVLKEALRQTFEWQRAGLDVHVAVNLSVKNLQNLELAENLGHLLSASGINAEKLVLEVTESAIMTDESRVQDILRKLAAQGVSIAIDDFGTGYSSFANLRRLPVSEIKVDKSFVIGMCSSNEDRIIVDSIVELGHKLGLSVVAEGVENLEAWRVLESLHCDLAQGYFLSRPLSPSDLFAWTRTFRAPSSAAPESLLAL